MVKNSVYNSTLTVYVLVNLFLLNYRTEEYLTLYRTNCFLAFLMKIAYRINGLYLRKERLNYHVIASLNGFLFS